MSPHDYLSQIQDFFGSDAEFACQTEGKGLFPVEPITPRLRAKNASGCSIFVRPASSKEPYYLLLDDLTPQQLKAHQHKPGRLTIETSPANYQVWIHFGTALNNPTKAALIRLCGADTAAAPRGRYGRCPGFLNKKASRTSPSERWAEGRQHWVQLTSCTPGLASLPENLIVHAEEATASQPAIALEAAPMEALIIAQSYYRRAAAKGVTNLSSVDFALIAALFSHKRFTSGQIAACIAQTSPCIAERKRNPNDYAARSVQAYLQLHPLP